MEVRKEKRNSCEDEGRWRKKSKGIHREITDDEINTYLVKKAIRATNKLNDRFGFVWQKKIERDVTQGVPLDEFTLDAEKKRQNERLAEIEKVKKRREQYALEKAKRDEELELIARERARAESDAYEKQEAEFLLSQSKLRARIRLSGGRAKPIDLLIMNLEDSCEFDVLLDEPCDVFKGLNLTEMESLREEIEIHLDFDKETPNHVEYWEALLEVCDWELAEVKNPKKLLHGIHSSVETDVKKLLEGRSHEELIALQSQIDSSMRCGSAKVVEFWEDVRKRLGVYKAKAYLKENHAKGNLVKKEMMAMEEDETIAETIAETEIKLDSQVSLSDDKYQPRKPKYMTRVHTGYVWNKYNRVHYDHDNPPPKFVQGYKFDVFYPDLMDKTTTPRYVIENDGDSTETCIIRFIAGPPYEDIAFRIVNQDWELSRKKGFQCTFNGDILRLYFNFKRYRYRR